MSAAICLPNEADARGIIRASVRRVPLAGESQTVCVPEGATLAQLVDAAFPDAFLRRFVVAIVGGVEIAADAWASLTPGAGDIINLCVRPGDGDSPVGKVLRTVLQIAVIAAAQWVGWSLGGIPGALASAAVAIVGNMLINTLIPIKPLNARGEAPEAQYTVTGARNAIRQYAPIPLILGKHRTFPPLYGNYVQETVGNEIFLRVPFCLGPAPLQISDIKIGETPLSSFEGVEIEQRLTADAPKHTLYTGDPDQDVVGVQLTTSYTTRNTTTNVDEIEVVLGWRGGLGGYDSKQRKTSKSVSVLVEYRPAGSSESWVSRRGNVVQANTASSDAGAPYRPDYFEVEDDLVVFNTRLGVAGVSGDPVAVSRSDPGRAFQYPVRFAVPRHPSGYEVRVRRATAEYTGTDGVDAVWWEILGSIKSDVDPFPEPGIASLVLRIKASKQLNNVIDSLNLVAEPMIPRFSSAAKATPSGATAASLTTVGVSRSPAEIALHLYRGAHTSRPRPDSKIDWPAWAAFAKFCEDEGLHYDEVVENAIGRGELARRVCSGAYARPVKWAGKLSVVIDRDRGSEAPAQVFTPRNVSNLRWTKTFPQDTHAVRIAFNNAANGWQADEAVLFLDGYDATNATIYEQLPVPGKTDADEVRIVGRQYINNSLLQTETFTFDMDAEALTCRLGAYAVLLHDAIDVGLGAHRVKSLEMSGPNVAAFVLDVGVATDPAATLAARWRKEDGSGGFVVSSEGSVTRDAANPARFVFPSPVTTANAPGVGDMTLIGRATEVSLPVLVRDIAPDFGNRAQVTLIPYAGGRFTPDGTPLPPHEPMVTLPIAARPAAPELLTTAANAREITLAFTQPLSPRGIVVTGYETAVREHGTASDSWQDRGPLPADARMFVAPPGNPGYSYDLRVVAVGRDVDGYAVTSDPLIASNVAAATTPAAPGTCAASFATRTSAGGASQLVLTATWAAVDDPDVLDTRVEMLVSTGPDVWAEIGQARAILGRVEIHGLQVGRSYTLGFVHLSRRGIASARTAITAITAPDTLVATAAVTAAAGSPLEADIAAAGVSAAADAAAAAASAAAAAASQTAASGSATAASGSATAANSSQTAAAGSATAAASSASAAAASASAAAGSASAASTSASAASTSASNAATSASAAQTSLVAVKVTAAAIFPATFERDGAFFTDDAGTVEPAELTATFADVSGIGRVVRATGNEHRLQRGLLTLVAGRTYRVSVKSRILTDATNGYAPTPLVGLWLFSATGYLSSGYWVSSLVTKSVADGWFTITGTFTLDALEAYLTGTVRVRAGAVPCWNGSGASNAVAETAFIRLEDITESTSAAGSASAAASSASSASASQSAAASSASAASTSATNAATQASNAATSATNASTSETNAAGSASTASTAATAAAASQSAAAGSASAASTSASTASTQASNASTSASAAATSATSAATQASNASTSASAASTSAGNAASSATTAGTHASNASGSASSASSSASAASASATAASNSATLAATYAAGSQGSINSSATFADNANATGIPTNWSEWENGSGTRVTGIAPQPYAFTLDGGAGVNAGVKQYRPGALTKGFYVLEADVTLNSGALTGAGVWFDWLVATVGTGTGLTFATDPDITGAVVGAGTPGRLYRFRKLVEVSAVPDNGHTSIYAMNHWSGFGSVASANSITWHRCAIRAASQAEIEARQAKLDLVTANANIATNASGIATNTSAISSLSATVSANFTSASRVNCNLLSNSTGLKGTAGWTNPGSWGAYAHPLWGHWFYRGFTGASGLTESFYTDEFTAYAGWTYYFSAVPYLYGLNAGTARFWLAFYNSSHSWIGEQSIWFTPSDSYNRLSNSISAPTGTAYARFGCSLSGVTGDSGYAEIGFWQAKVEFQGSTAWRGDGELTDTVSRVTAAEVNITTNASAIATETSARAASEAVLRASIYGKTDSVIPDADMRDTDWWNNASGCTFGDADGGWRTRRQIVFGNGTYDQYSEYFPVEPGATYRIRARIWNNGGSWSGWFHPLIHIPYYAWWSLKHGTPIDPSFHDSTNGIVAAQDTGELEWILTNPTGITNNANRQWQFRFYGSFTGGPVVITVEIIRLDQYATVHTLDEAFIDGTTGLALARFVKEASATGGRPARFSLYSDSEGTSFAALDAARVFFGDDTVWEDTYNTFYTESGGKRIRYGGPFGTGGNLFLWTGPDTVPLNSETKANAKFAIALDQDLPVVDGSTIITPTAADQTFTKSSTYTNKTTSGTTFTTLATIDVNSVGAGGYLSLVLGNLFFGASGITLSAGTTWDGEMVLTEQLQSGGTETTLLTHALQVEDTGGGFFTINWPGDIPPWPSALLPQTISGNMRYRLKLRRTSGSNDITGNGVRGTMMIQRVPG